ncbi:MAG: hypothetical protein ACTHMS_08025 [Jatrophihabitans sp.]|uniref:hypothetical protein n=1 Tax=Jatrophihabitans sp. TaxID=1932789 RepID=UPI003F80C5E4
MSLLRSHSAEAAVFVVGVVLRLAVVVRGGGLGADFSYDPAVYFAASDALQHGRLPYRDFTLVHPPGVTLALLPFTVLTRIVTDHQAYVLANLAFIVMAGVNAVLVVRIGRRIGLGRAAIGAGCLYAVWFGALSAEYSIRLEPLGNLLLLIGLLLVLPAGDGSVRRPRSLLLGGLALGATIGVKIWWVVPVVLIVGRLLVTYRRRMLPALLGAVIAPIVINGPFFLVAPRAMWDALVTSQVGRARDHFGVVQRLAQMTGAPLDSSSSTAARWLALVVLGAVIVLASARVSRHPVGRLLVVVLAVQVLVLLLAPTYYFNYHDYYAVPLCLVVAGGLVLPRTDAQQQRAAVLASPVAVVVAAALIGSIVGVADRVDNRIMPFRGARQLASEVRGARCVLADSPTPLIELDVLSAGFEHGCANWVDTTGRFLLSRYRLGTPGAANPRRNPVWQRDLVAYLGSGDAVVLGRIRNDGLTEQSLRAVSAGQRTARLPGNRVIRRTR